MLGQFLNNQPKAATLSALRARLLADSPAQALVSRHGRLLTLRHQRQQNAADCLAACAAMMLGAVGHAIPYRRLLSLLEVGPTGASHRKLQRLAAETPDIEVVHGQGRPADLAISVDSGLPIALFVWTAELPYWDVATRHALVTVGYDETHYYVHDPALPNGPRRVRRGDLELAWIAGDSYYTILTRATTAGDG